MNRIAILALLLCITALATVASAGETYFSFTVDSRAELEKLTRVISIDNVMDKQVFAYANDDQLAAFDKMGYTYDILPHPGTLNTEQMADSKEAMTDWDAYPTYSHYVALMDSFAVTYPDICEIVSIGTSTNGKQLLFAKISDNVGTEEDEPEVMYTSSMHGDETTGYVLMLRLIDSLLVGYGVDPAITAMVDEMEFWINPLANPDGTYGTGNIISSPTRGNANGVDLNRNYPDPPSTDHPDGQAWQAETIAFMAAADSLSWVISANMHGGAEVANYPWDTWVRRHPDDQWWQNVCRDYADSAQYYSPSGYLTQENNGITNGYDWYQTDGSRQDYMNWYKGCREMTLELSYTKFLSASSLPAHWDYNKRSFLQYLGAARYGIRGIVTDAVTSAPVAATVTVLNHDIDNSQIYTDPDVGDYHRMIETGTYDLEFSCPGYYTDTVTGISATETSSTRVDVQLVPLPDDPVLSIVETQASTSNPGDDVLLNITLTNIGGGNAVGVNGVLSTTDSRISITQATSAYPTMGALGGTGTSLTAYEFTIDPGCPLYETISIDLQVTDNDTYDSTLSFGFFVGDRVAIYVDDFSSNQGWTGMGGSGEWEIGSAGGLGGDPSSDHSASSDNGVLGNDLSSAGTYANNLTQTYWATSPSIDCSNATGVLMSYYHWLGVERNQYDHAYFEVWDGDSWETIFENDNTTITESAWNLEEYDLSVYADGNPSFQLRFGIGITDGSGQYAGWNVDDIDIRGYVSGGSASILIAPAEVTDSLQPGDDNTQYIKVKNTGDANLGVWFSSTEPWLSFATAKQTVAPGDSMDYALTITTTGLTAGDFAGALNFSCNDASQPTGSIPVYLHIFAPDLLVDGSGITQSVAPDGLETYPLVIENNGPGRLIYQVAAQMDAKSSVPVTADYAAAEPLGYRTVINEKGADYTEAFYPAVVTSSGGPDTFGHQWTDSDEPGGPTYGWVDIATLGTSVSLTDDGIGGPYSIGFSFPFYDNSYTSFYIAANGMITFDGSFGTAGNTSLPNASANAMIALWWDDLDPSAGGNIYYYYDAALQRLVVSYVSVPNYSYPDGTGDLSFQAILSANGDILLQYGSMYAGADADGFTGATIGIQNSAVNDALQIVSNAAYMHSDLAIAIGTDSWLSVDPVTGTVDPYSQTTVDVLFDATDMEVGDYTGEITITSNDPTGGSAAIPVTMSVSSGCCVGTAGNIQLVGSCDPASQGVDVADLTNLINHLFIGFDELCCLEETDIAPSISGGTPDGTVDVSDLTAMIDHLFITFPALP
ncbi:MAG: hypothetical protein KKA42_01300, partial [candidate division Zixibacteria bacterium]|nr:hypothetical protein [candidate division Zixibacteria bacterium]